MADVVNIKAPDGSLVPFRDPKLIQQALAAGGTVATDADVRNQQLQAEYGGLGGQAASFGMGAASGLTFGLSDAAVAGLGGQEWLKNNAEANQNARTAGEIGGVAGSLLVPGLGQAEGANLAARGARVATALPRAVSGLGRAAEGGLAHVLEAEGAGFARRAATQALTGAASGAAEGALYGVGHEVSDASINDHDLTAEKLLAGASHGALWGGGLGAGVGLAGEVASTAGKGIAKALEGSSLAETLDNMSGAAAARSAGGGKAAFKRAEKFGDGFEEWGKVVRDDAPAYAGKSSIKDMDLADLKVAGREGSKDWGEKLGKLVNKMDEKATRPNAMAIASDIEDVANEVSQRMGQGPAVSKLRQAAEDAKRILGLVDSTGQLVPDAGNMTASYEALQRLRIDADAIWKGAGKDPAMHGSSKFFGKVRDRLEERVLAGAEEAGVKDAYLLAKKKAQAFFMLRDAAESGNASNGGNRFFSLTDNLAAHAGTVAGGIVGGHLGAAIGGAVGGAASRFVRTRGDFVAADMLHRASQLGAIQNISMQVDKRIAHGVRSFLQKGVSEEGAKARDHAAASAQAAAIAQAAGNSALLERRISDYAGSLGGVAPGIRTALVSKVVAAHGYLAPKMPTPRGDAVVLQPKFAKPRIDPIAVAKAAQFIEGHQDPLSLLDDMRHGRLSREKVDAVKTYLPGVFAQIQDELGEQVASLDKKLTYPQKLQLSILMGVPADPSLDPSYIALVQSSKAPVEDSKDGPNGGGRRPIKVDANMYRTEVTHLPR